MRKQKFIFVSGGVISGLGKGITTAAISLLLKSRGYKITPVKIDMYLNLDAGTIRPQEHGEVFVTADGVETDQDIGNYERFLNESLKRVNYITTGQIYAEVIRKERAFKYEGEDVEAIPHVTDEIIRRIMMAGKENKAEIIIIELGRMLMLFFQMMMLFVISCNIRSISLILLLLFNKFLVFFCTKIRR